MNLQQNIEHIKRFRDAVGEPIKNFLGTDSVVVFYAPTVSDYAAGLTVYLKSNGYDVMQQSVSRGSSGLRGFRNTPVRHKKTIFVDVRYDASAIRSIREWVDYLKSGSESTNGLLGVLYVNVFETPRIEVLYELPQNAAPSAEDEIPV